MHRKARKGAQSDRNVQRIGDHGQVLARHQSRRDFRCGGLGVKDQGFAVADQTGRKRADLGLFVHVFLMMLYHRPGRRRHWVQEGATMFAGESFALG